MPINNAVRRVWPIATMALLGLLLPPTERVVGANSTPDEIVLVEPALVASDTVAQWKREGFKGVAVVLDERHSEKTYADLAKRISNEALDIYYWIEVARQPGLAEAHPRWMASLGMHDDWKKTFPTAPKAKDSEVAKAFPWVPIHYREAFDAHLTRLEQLLGRVPPGYRGLLLNDLQGGPSSCGCGNLQCRWATDYHVAATGSLIEGDDIAARFVAAAKKLAAGKRVIPIWTTECEEVDLPAKKRANGTTTGLCGTVNCSVGTCPKAFTKQWRALTASHDGPVGLLGAHGPLLRTQSEFGGGPTWWTNALSYLDTTLPANGGTTMPHDRLWIVVQGRTAEEEGAARRAAAKSGISTVIVARTELDQSYEPRLVPINQP